MIPKAKKKKVKEKWKLKFEGKKEKRDLGEPSPHAKSDQNKINRFSELGIRQGWTLLPSDHVM